MLTQHLARSERFYSQGTMGNFVDRTWMRDLFKKNEEKHSVSNFVRLYDDDDRSGALYFYFPLVLTFSSGILLFC